MRPGLLEHAHGGTLFLDEIADMPPTTQAKILRVLTDQSYHRVGGQRPVKVDVRVLSATSRNLQDEIAAGRFREDLFYRLNVVPVRLPPLRERREDIPELVSHFLARFAAERRMSPPRISEEAMAALQAHDWPGNVRQLRNIIERTLILAPGDRVSCIEVDLLPPEILDNQSAMGGASDGDGDHGQPAARSPRILRARVSEDPDPALFRQHLAHRIVHRHGTLGIAPEAQGVGHRRQEGRGGVGGHAMAARSLSLQDHFLNSVRRAKLPVTIFLVKGVKLQGVDHLVRRFLAAAAARGRVAARLQACDLDDHAGRAAAGLRRHRRPASRRAKAAACRTCSSPPRRASRSA